MLLFLCFLVAIYFAVGHLFLKLLLWIHQDRHLVSMPGDPLAMKALFWFLALLIWPSYLFDLGEALVSRRDKNR